MRKHRYFKQHYRINYAFTACRSCLCYEEYPRIECLCGDNNHNDIRSCNILAKRYNLDGPTQISFTSYESLH